MRISRFVIDGLALVALLAPLAAAQQLEPRPVPTGRVESFTFQSPSMGVRYAVNVGIPAGYKPGDGKRYPALIVTDGDWWFPVVNAAARTLNGAIEGLFLVSIGTAVDDGDTVYTQRRVYEFSPPGWDMKDPFGQVVSSGCETWHRTHDQCVGGAPRFLNAIVKELIPLVAAKYPIDADQLGLFGISAGGFFASWVIFQSQSPFKKYLISSPAMAYGDGSIFREEERYAADHKDLPVSIYMGAGTLEASDPFLEGIGKIVSGMSHLAGVLRGRRYPGLELTVEYHPGLSHTDVLGTTAARGLRVLYGK